MRKEKVLSLKCPNCGVSVGRNDKVCEYCKSPIYVKSVREVASIIRNGKRGKSPWQTTNDYINFYNKKLIENSSHVDSFLSLGLFYIETKQAEKAIENLEKAKDLSPMNASIYFYLALAMVCKKRPRVMSKKEVLKIEEQLEAAICIDPEMGVVDLLLGVVKYDFYTMNGLRISGLSPEELISIAKGKSIDPDDSAKILELCAFNGNPILGYMRDMGL